MASLLECVLVTGELLEGAAAAAMSAQWAAAAEALKRLVEADLDSRRGSESVADLLPRRQLGVAVLLELGHLASVHGEGCCACGAAIPINTHNNAYFALFLSLSLSLSLL